MLIGCCCDSSGRVQSGRLKSNKIEIMLAKKLLKEGKSEFLKWSAVRFPSARVLNGVFLWISSGRFDRTARECP